MSWFGGEDLVGIWDLIKDVKIGRKKNKPLTAERKKVLERRAKEKKNKRKSR